MKIDPYNFPILIIAAFVIGVLLAMLLGFRPQHGSTEQSLLFLLVQCAEFRSPPL
jgi:hypothetical protein